MKSEKLAKVACKSLICTISYQTARGISAAMASSIPLAASGGLVGISLAIQQPIPSMHIGIIRDEDSRSSGASFLHGIADAGEHRPVQVRRAGLLGVGTTNNLGT